MPKSMLPGSPPVLPIQRQPSPLSFSSVSGDEPSSPVMRATALPSTSYTEIPKQIASELQYSPSNSSTLPIDPQPDSLLLRSTFSALEHSSTTLKRLSKSVLSATASYLASLEQLERAEDDLFSQLSELGRWLEGGYGISADGSVWDDAVGVGKVRKERRRREREQVELKVEGGVRAVKAELKRNGLAGGGAQARFDVRSWHPTLTALTGADEMKDHRQTLLQPDLSLPLTSTRESYRGRPILDSTWPSLHVRLFEAWSWNTNHLF